ncbi:MAG: YggS family pyridoxal phosphate-dependent enzyme [Acidimicrobiia bacterium]
MNVEEAVAAVRARIDAAAARAGRDPAEVTLVAATKTVDPERVRAVVAAGVADLGENRAQELLEKAPVVDGARWHFVGALQRNKVRALAPWVVCWHSVDRDALGAEIARRAPGARVLVEVNLAEESQKHGCAPAQAPALVDVLCGQGLAVDGLMALPPAGDDPRRWFAALRELATRLDLRELSMGMSDDFEVAVEEGATMVRVGRALFGDRPLPASPERRR